MLRLFLTLTLSLALSAAPALADKDPAFCPPGLAKKAVPCVPPGLAKKGQHHWHPGDIVDRDETDLHVILYPNRYQLPPLGPDERYIVIGGQILKVNEATWEVITLMQVIDVLLD